MFSDNGSHYCNIPVNPINTSPSDLPEIKLPKASLPQIVLPKIEPIVEQESNPNQVVTPVLAPIQTVALRNSLQPQQSPDPTPSVKLISASQPPVTRNISSVISTKNETLSHFKNPANPVQTAVQVAAKSTPLQAAQTDSQTSPKTLAFPEDPAKKQAPPTLRIQTQDQIAPEPPVANTHAPPKPLSSS